MTAPTIDQTINKLNDIRTELARHIIGQQTVIDQTLTGILAGGHVMLMGVPGLAKTRLVEVTGTVLGLDTRRVQCTPDLMPADVLGAEVLEQQADGTRHFRFIPGPVFCQFLMVDEINRAAPRTQSAFLQAMQEHEVSVNGINHPLPHPFHVLATRNPIEHEGTYPLPEAQLDRFLLQVTITYPDRDAEREILRATTTGTTTPVANIITAPELITMQEQVKTLPIGEKVIDGIITLIRRLRPSDGDNNDSMPDVAPYLDYAPGVRATQSISLAARAAALLDGRTAPSMDDVIALAPAVLSHRIQPNYRARADGITMDALIARATKGL